MAYVSTTIMSPSKERVVGQVSVQSGFAKKGDHEVVGAIIEILKHETSKKTGRQRERRAFMFVHEDEAIIIREALNQALRDIRREKRKAAQVAEFQELVKPKPKGVARLEAMGFAMKKKRKAK